MIFLKLRSEPVGQHGGWFLIGENFLVCIQGPVQLNLLCSLGHPTQARSEGVCRVLCAFLKCPVRSHMSNESALHIRWPKYWSFSFNISPFNEHPELASFKMDWLDLLAVQGTLKSLIQHHSSKASILRLRYRAWAQSWSSAALAPHGLSMEFSRPEYWSG